MAENKKTPRKGGVDFQMRRGRSVFAAARRRDVVGVRLFHSESNPRFLQIVGAHLHFHHIPSGDLDKIFPELTGNMREDHVLIG
jgi:hypothetical protein